MFNLRNNPGVKTRRYVNKHLFLYYTIRQRHEKLLISSDDKQYLMPINISLTYKTFLLIFPTLKIDENSYLLIIIMWFPFMKKEVVLF